MDRKRLQVILIFEIIKKYFVYILIVICCSDAVQPLKDAISDTEKEDIRSKLIKNNALLKIILPVVIESGIITESNHAHSIFFSGQLPIDL